MFNEISYYLIFGKPLIVYLGIITFLLLLSTATIGFLTYTRKTNIPFKWHTRLAAIALIFAVIHGALGILSYF